MVMDASKLFLRIDQSIFALQESGYGYFHLFMCLKLVFNDSNIISEHNRNFPFVVDLPVSGMNLSWGRYRVKPSPLCCSQEDLHRGLPLISIASLWLRLIPWPLLIFFFQKKAGLHIYVYFTPEFYQAHCILILIRQKKTCD